MEEALVDVGQRLPSEQLVQLLADAFRLRSTNPDRVRDELGRRQRVRQRVRFVELLADLQGIESTLEYVFRRDIERAHHLPDGRRQGSITPGTRTDVIYDDQRVLAEIDGRLGHESAASAFRDLRRDNRHAASDYTTLRYGSADIRTRPCAVAKQLWQVLASRGWPHPFHPCSRCR